MMRRGEGSGGVPESDGVSRAQTEAQPILGQLQLLDLIVLTSHSSIFSEIDAGDPVRSQPGQRHREVTHGRTASASS